MGAAKDTGFRLGSSNHLESLLRLAPVHWETLLACAPDTASFKFLSSSQTVPKTFSPVAISHLAVACCPRGCPPPKLLTGIDLHGSPDVNHATSAGAAGVVTKQVYKWGKKYQCLPVVHLRRPLASEFYSQKVIMEGQQQLIGAALPDFSGLIELVSASGTVEPAKVTVVSSFLCITKVKVKGEEVSGASVLVNGKHEHNPCFFAGRRIPDQLGSFDRLRKSLAINCTNFKLLWTFAPAERRENGNNFSNPSVSRCDLPSRALSRHSHPFR